MLSQFPRFTSLQDLDYQDVDALVRGHLPFSDFTASSIWSWDIEDKLKVSVLHGNLIICFCDYSDGSFFYSFIGEDKLDETANALIDLSVSEQLEPVLYLIPETVAQKLDPALFEVREDPDQFDYVLSAEALCKYEGGRFASKRNEVRKFCARHPDAVTDIVSFDDPAIFQQCRALFRGWQKAKLENSGSWNYREFEAFKRCIMIRGDVDLFGIGIWIAGRLAAFSVCETGHDGYGFVHFEKADTAAYPGITAYLSQKVAGEFASRGVRYLNIEQDLGVPGLRANKLSYSPCQIMKKYRVSRLASEHNAVQHAPLTVHYRERPLVLST